MRIFKVVLLYILVMITLTQCATLGERTVRINTAQIQQKLNGKLAQPLTVLKVFQVQLSNALVVPEAASGRLNTTMDTVITSPLLQQSLTGKLAISGILKFDAARYAVILDAPVVEVVQLDGASSDLHAMVNKLAREMGSKWMNQLVLYQVKPEDLTVSGTHYQPSDLRVTDDGVQITLNPQR
ncbi:DUF1439 domain-containing protein [Methylophilus aquaticus]|uniref:DUF1439 domain-containing protein n=1 Tax=Methylophilus aquaticus TaxID=1971610 RepID=A0ABT9JV68_9PROT|nr:DUF1439 domain-containing protein [Methylophilus aquaticus]MDP8568418.1 DUF1439 domain-containing protein [Methylophilus aquaticus]